MNSAEKLPERKPTRLKYFDYSSPGAYFVTVCTKNRQKLLSRIVVGEGLCALPQNELTHIGIITEDAVKYINENVEGVCIDKYVVMPNHIHMIIVLDDSGGRGNPPLQNVVGQLKSYTTKVYGNILWQRSFHDHIIRDKKDYEKIWKYIDENVLNWDKDCFYI